MRIMVPSLCLLGLLAGCENNTSANNAPLLEAQWRHQGDASYLYSGVGLQRNDDGRLIYAYRTGGDSESPRVRRVGVQLATAQGDDLGIHYLADPYHYDSESPSLPMQVSTKAHFLAFDNGEFLVFTPNGNFFQLNHNGELISEYSWAALGFDRLAVVAQNGQRVCLGGRNETAAGLVCIAPDGTVLSQHPIPLSEAPHRKHPPQVSAVLTQSSNLIQAKIQDGTVMLSQWSDGGALEWEVPLDLPTVNMRQIKAFALAAGHAVIALRETAADASTSYRVLHVDANGAVQQAITGKDMRFDSVRIVPFNNTSYLLLDGGERNNVQYGKAFADVYRFSATGQKLWRFPVSLDAIATERDSVWDLQIQVSSGVISLLQNRQSVIVYAAAPLPVGLTQFIDNIFVSRYGSDGKLINESVIGRLNYLVDYEGAVFKFNQLGFYPKWLVGDGTSAFVGGTTMDQPEGEDVAEFATLARFDLNR